MTEYDNLADIYEPWSAADPAADLTQQFYLCISGGIRGSVVELGVGTGRIAVEIAARYGRNVIGIDLSEVMLTKCRARARARGVEHLIQLTKADIREFCLPEPADLIIMPFRTFGHLLSVDDKLAALRQIYSQLAPGGVLVFDHYVFNENWARNHNGVPRLMCTVHDGSTGNKEFVWDTYRYDFSVQLMECIITVEVAEANGIVFSRQHCPLSFSWVEPDQVRSWVQDIGYEVRRVYGSFDKKPFNPSSTEQIWVLGRACT